MTIEITPAIQEFLSRPLLARLATASPEVQPHVVPVWFLWEDGFIWVSSYRSTRKITDLERNPKYAIVIDVEQAAGRWQRLRSKATPNWSTPPKPRLAPASNASMPNISARRVFWRQPRKAGSTLKKTC